MGNNIKNELAIEVYSSGTSKIYDTKNELLNGESLWFESGYPTGDLAGSITIPRKDPSRWWEVKGTLRVVVRNGQQIVYEGYIPDLQDYRQTTSQGVVIKFLGGWGWHMMNRTMRKRWADNRVDQQTWEYQDAATATGADKCTLRRDGRLYFVPKTEAWANTEYAAARYTMPTGNIERITFNYDFTEEAGQNWTVSLFDVDNTSTEWTLSATGSGSVDLDSTNDYTATTKFEFRITSNAAQTPTNSGSTNLKITSLMVYGEDETGTGISLNTICADIIAAHTDIFNSSTAYLEATNARTVEPFISGNDDYATLADIVTQMAGFGDSNDGRYAVGVLNSEYAASPDGNMVLYTADYPDVDADYDLFLSPSDDRIVGALNITKDYSLIANYLYVSYLNEQNFRVYLNPADHAELTDATSVSSYGTRTLAIDLGNSTQTNALDYGSRYLAQYKDPLWVVDGSIQILGSIDDANGQPIAASMLPRIRGKRLKVDGYDTFVITRARYDHESETVSLTIGPVVAPQFTESVFAQTWNDEIATGDDTSGAQVSMKTWFERADLIGRKKRRELRDAGLWQEYKREHFRDAVAKLKQRRANRR